MTPLNPHTEAVTVAAFRWAMQPERLADMRGCVAKLDRISVLEQLRALNRLQAALLDRLRITTDEVIAAREKADRARWLVAMATLTPDALLDDFTINGRNG